VVLARELTKKFEEFLRGKPAELLEIARKRSLKGEFVVMVGPGTVRLLKNLQNDRSGVSAERRNPAT
jgi:16S rRNA C1402 (ribose-2'-O) methylase RsmI